ncbi:MAG: GFA family protein [Hyphomicrobium sp.]
MSAQQHTGSCHCGAVRYEVTADVDKSISCNCSICRRTGMILTFVPASQFTLVSGTDGLSDYQFGKKAIHHLFCKTCGVRSFGRGTGPDGSEMVAINVRCLDGIDPDALTPHKFDGAKL